MKDSEIKIEKTFLTIWEEKLINTSDLLNIEFIPDNINATIIMRNKFQTKKDQGLCIDDNPTKELLYFHQILEVTQ